MIGIRKSANILKKIPSILRKYLQKDQRPTYIYEAEVVRWVDGDTVELVVDVGFYLNFGREDRPIDFRLYGIDAPERGHADYTKSKQLAESLAPVGSTVLIKSVKDDDGELSDSFGRYIGIVYVPGTEKSVNELLVDANLAIVKYEW